MINSVQITNHLGESIKLELRFPERSGFLVRGIDGLGPSKAEINTTDVSEFDGAIFNSARVGKRNIVFSLGFIEKPTIEDTRQLSYKYFPIKRNIEILIETDNRICKTTGYVESNEPTIFSDQEGALISVICPRAYLYSVTKNITEFSVVLPGFEFPFDNNSLVDPLLEMGQIDSSTSKSVVYTGDAAVGVLINIHALGSASGVVVSIYQPGKKDLAIDSDRLVALTGSDIIAGDDIFISTVKGEKYAVLVRAGVTYNIMNALDQFPIWFEIEKGDNIFSYSAETGDTNLQVRIENEIAYEGV